MNAEALTVNTSTLTAIRNDYSYERVFCQTIRGESKTGRYADCYLYQRNIEECVRSTALCEKQGIKTVL